MRKALFAITAVVCFCGTAMAADPIIDTIAGGGTTAPGDGGPAKQAALGNVSDVAVDAVGNVYLADSCRIRKVDTAGIITTIAGNGVSSSPGPANGAQATSASVCSPSVAVDAFGYVYYSWLGRVGKISPTGVVTIVAGTGTEGYSGDGGLATSARIDYHIPDIAFDPAGNMYIADLTRVRKVGTDGIITTVAGNGTTGDAGDYGPATSASVSASDLAFDGYGNMFIADRAGSVRKVDRSGMITRVWGGWPYYRSDPVAVNTDAYYPTGLAVDRAGNLYVSNLQNFISIIDIHSAIKHVIGVVIDTPWGYGAPGGFEGDGGPAGSAKILEPEAITMDAQGNLYIADTGNQRVRKVTGKFTPPAALPAGAYAFDHARAMPLVSANQYTVGIVRGDANGDSRTDLFLLAGSWSRFDTYPGDYALYVYRQNVDGTLAAPLSTKVPHVELHDVIATNLNHDRYTDIVFAASDYDGLKDGVFVMLGSATGMGAPVRYAGINGANGAHGLNQADMNHDGHMDVLAFLSTGGSGAGTFANWAIYYGDGTGRLVSKALTPVSNGSYTLVHDLNDDGLPDMLWGWNSSSDSGVAVAYHDGVKNFSPPTVYPGTHVSKRSGPWAALADFDSDGVEEVIFSIDDNAPNSKLVRWVRGPGGGFDYAGEWPTYDIPQTLIASDMNNDGFDDLLVRHTGWSAIGYLQQTRMGDGTLGLDREVKAYANVANQANQHSMTVGDFNGDQCLDIAVSGTNSGLQIQYGKRCFRVKQTPDSPLPPLRGTTEGTTAIVASEGPQAQSVSGVSEQTRLPMATSPRSTSFGRSLGGIIPYVLGFVALWWFVARYWWLPVLRLPWTKVGK